MKVVVRILVSLGIVLSTSLVYSAKHPVPLDKNTDSAKCIECHSDKTGDKAKGASVHSAIAMGCTTCHNADDNREFGGTGPNGPHGSQYSHMMERRYEFSQVAAAAGPGSPIQNLFPSPDLTAGGAAAGPYALCGKCHSLSNILSDASFRPGTTGKGGHFTHISEQGVSCSVCHTAHGMGSVSAGITGERLVNFDAKVVAPNGATPISYNHSTNTCTLKCHGYYHNSDGSVSSVPPAQ